MEKNKLFKNCGIYFRMISLILLLTTCFSKPVPVIPPEVVLTDIYNITDSSACFICLVEQESNARLDGLWLIIDTIKTDKDVNNLTDVPLFYFYEDKLKIGMIDTLIITDLKENTHYFTHLYYKGKFDTGGIEDEFHYFIGEQKEFTTLP